jgi:nitrite reductase/ring-hydroxylating ferredoxin subunit
MLAAPAADRFPAYPSSWYLFCQSGALRHRPLSRTMLGRRLVAFRTASGRLTVLDGSCSHLGANLGRGRVVGEAIQCPFHHWEYGPDGRCTHIPASSKIPARARQASYPAVERHGYVFFFNGPKPRFPLPFFSLARPEDFIASRPFGAVLDCQWYMIGANAFDLQHFRAAHDRRLICQPVIDCPAPLARRATGRFSVVGNSVPDRLTRWFAGDEVEMSITDWCGNLMFATATFRRTRSYGMVITEPLATGGVAVQVIVFVPRSARRLGRVLIDPMHLWIRRLFIKQFLSSDAARLGGSSYNPIGLIEPDQELVDYFRWLAGVAQGSRRDDHEMVDDAYGPGGRTGGACATLGPRTETGCSRRPGP